MKIDIRREELRQVLSGYFRTEVEEFTIVPGDPSPLGNVLRSSVSNPIDKTLNLVNIKSLRAAIEKLELKMTLMEGKWAVQHWQQFIEFVDEYNRLPISGYGCGTEDEGKLR